MAMTESQGGVVGWALRTSLAETLVKGLATRTVVDRLAVFFMALVIAGVAAYSWLRPAYNWDMVAYVATALENRIDDPAALHERTWAEIEPGAREAQLYHLQFSNPYNLHQWENPADFQSQLSMYRVKVLYVAMLRWLEPVAGLSTASILLSVLPSVVFGALCLWWLAREGAEQGLLLLVPFLATADFITMTTMVTPDMLLAVMSLGAVLLLLRGRDGLAGLLLFASVFVRPDNIILIFALLIAAVLFGWRLLPMLATFVVSFAACLLISKFGDHPGWWAHFYFSCVQIQNSMTGFAPDFSLVDFTKGYVRGVAVALTENDWPGLFLVLIVGWAMLARAGRIGSGRTNALVFALAIGTLGKFASFPLPDDRFYFTFIAAMGVILIAAWKPRVDLSARAG
ncbi:hypothetical protein EJC49_03260 [Aquibium carbonis]|uniref:DUF2029 domain-containing protein n=1 Tax=Aquibium carbonis TaxID=2495581 RepID=A0A429Z2D6_9HYPH|nr:hypothetical protein [Aquibium carbonis]RST87857.1 hypothetical protein EJC49_03260 [Aquibium carbonis]